MKDVAVAEYGEVVDLPFPTVPPGTNTEEVEALAVNYFARIRNIIREHNTSPESVTVHLMGEFTFTFGLLSLLQASGIRAVASTSERNTIDQPDGSKTVVFKFVRFREYYTFGSERISLNQAQSSITSP